MTTLVLSDCSTEVAAPARQAGLRRLDIAWIAMLRWYQRRRAIRRLESFEDRLLCDMGFDPENLPASYTRRLNDLRGGHIGR